MLRALRATEAGSARAEAARWEAALWQAHWIVAAVGKTDSLLRIPELECVVDQPTVLTDRSYHGMLAHKWQQLLSECLTLDSARMVRS